MRMTREELERLPSDELQIIARRKTKKKKNATPDANEAQSILWERSGEGYNSGLSKRRYGSKEFNEEEE